MHSKSGQGRLIDTYGTPTTGMTATYIFGIVLIIVPFFLSSVVVPEDAGTTLVVMGLFFGLPGIGIIAWAWRRTGSAISLYENGVEVSTKSYDTFYKFSDIEGIQVDASQKLGMSSTGSSGYFYFRDRYRFYEDGEEGFVVDRKYRDFKKLGEAITARVLPALAARDLNTLADGETCTYRLKGQWGKNITLKITQDGIQQDNDAVVDWKSIYTLEDREGDTFLLDTSGNTLQELQVYNTQNGMVALVVIRYIVNAIKTTGQSPPEIIQARAWSGGELATTE